MLPAVLCSSSQELEIKKTSRAGAKLMASCPCFFIVLTDLMIPPGRCRHEPLHPSDPLIRPFSTSLPEPPQMISKAMGLSLDGESYSGSGHSLRYEAACLVMSFSGFGHSGIVWWVEKIVVRASPGIALVFVSSKPFCSASRLSLESWV